MKHRTRICALALTCTMSLSLAACGGKDAGDSDTSPAPISTLPPDFEVDLDMEDLWQAVAGIDSDFELFTVNGEPVPACLYLYTLAGSIVTYANNNNGLDWTTTVEDGTPLADYLKESALNATVMSIQMASNAEERELGMTQEQIEDLDNYMAMMTMMSGGEDIFNDSMRQVGLDYDTFYQLNTYYYYYNQLLDGLYSDEEVSTYIDENVMYAKHILLMTVDAATREPLDEETIAEKKATAEEVLAQLQDSSDLLTDFDTLMNEYSEDTGLTANPDGYMFFPGQMVSEFEEGTKALKFGEISGLVESEFGYHIILRLDPDSNETLLDSMSEQARATLLGEQMNAWVDEAEVVCTDEYNALDVPLFYAKYQAYQEAFEAAAAEAEAAETEPPAENDVEGTEDTTDPETTPSPTAGDEPED